MSGLSLNLIFQNEFEVNGVWQVLELKGWYDIYYRYINNYGATVSINKNQENLFEVQLTKETYFGSKIIDNKIIGFQGKIILSSMKEVNEILNKIKNLKEVEL